MTSREAAEAAGISLPWLHWLVQQGLAEPGVRRSRKQGSAAEWSDEDVETLQEMKIAREELSALGRRRVPPIRLRALKDTAGLLVVSQTGIVSRITEDTTIGQLLHTLRGSFAVLDLGDLE